MGETDSAGIFVGFTLGFASGLLFGFVLGLVLGPGLGLVEGVPVPPLSESVVIWGLGDNPGADPNTKMRPTKIIADKTATIL